MKERQVEVVVISDVHLGTFGCHAPELLKYLKSIRPQKLILNGDIVDIWQFSKSYWPESHMKVLRKLMKFISEDVEVHYLTGNHDELLRKFADFRLGSFQLANKLVLECNGRRMWFFHGDVFDLTMQHSKWLAKLGAVGYDLLILLNRFVNRLLDLLGKEKMSFSKRIKRSFKDAVKFINDFENTAAELAIAKGYDFVICGHIHQPEIREVKLQQGETVYLNSGDWVENLTALEFNEGEWRIFRYDARDFGSPLDENDLQDQLDTKLRLDVKTLLKQIKTESI